MGPRACQLVSVSSASGVLRRTEPTRADDNRKPVPMSAIVTIRKHRSDVPDLTPEEHRRRGDATEAVNDGACSLRGAARLLAQASNQGQDGSDEGDECEQD
jgi:hypothetical protein